MVERIQPQLVMFSTANQTPTTTYPGFAASAGEAEDRLLIEWSAPPEAQDYITDRRFWEMASPHWTPQRERMMERQLAKANRGDFLANWMNCWPQDANAHGDEKAVPRWANLPVAPPQPLRGGIVCIDEFRDATGFGCLRLVGDAAYYSEHQTLESACVIANTADSVVVGLTLVSASDKAGLRITPVRYGVRELRAYSPLLQSTVAAGRLRHDHHPEMLVQAAGAVVVETEGGKVLSARKSDADVVSLKLLAWALGYQRSAADAPRARVY
jgi:hypothetical protein